MPSTVEITIPNSTLVEGYTKYNITIRLPLRSYVVQKRYSEFASFHDSLSHQVGAQPPVPLPKKSWFSNTNSNERLREERRQGLEKYLQAINNTEDQRWRNTSIWRSFLNLPSQSISVDNSSSTRLHKAITVPGSVGSAPIIDPVLWLDCHRELKTHLHDARLHLTRRDQATSPQKQHESSAHAKSSLTKAGTMILALEGGLKDPGNDAWVGSGLGEGEIRRRKDLLASAKKEKDGLENLHSAMMQKSKLDAAVASIQDKDKLIGSAKPRVGRVLGKETDKTRELDNQGVLQLQKQTMENQDKSVDELMKIITRQRELGVAINNELEIQNELLKLTDEDTERLERKIEIGKKRVGKIS
ncbi:putative SNARE complex subunit [Talaromyces proteolyticus]|uniref:SNARE complex subunit n=1 Tax=Talaromyces proteolyticus TaxID=1131652 RepID=A0AAD4KQ03_9EURO|nr:putative SNARE complex subunit [Talaromyces proteolyticus]KAH8692934.1 putative SNARE complex subunit [Talaromyces proteolyticus]